jgi:elongator complex protein 3
MPNLLGSSPERDRIDFKRLFDDADFRPDEIKIYPCSLVRNTGLEVHYRRGEWRPYSLDELLSVLHTVLRLTPRYCRINRVIRDISSGDILAGNTRSNLREVAERDLRDQGVRPQEIRCREIRDRSFDPESISLRETAYRSGAGEERFIEYVTHNDELVGFTRLSLPVRESTIPEIARSALLREVHVYGASLDLGGRDTTKPQHQGLGQRLIEETASRARQHGFADLAVISAVGTRDYYRTLGFGDGRLYQHRTLRGT